MSDTTQAPPKRPYNRRPPVRTAEVRPEPVRAEEVRPKRERTRKGTGTDRLHIPQHLIPDGVDLQWVTDTILGQPATQTRIGFEVNGWQPVTPDMFGGRYDGMFMPKGFKGEINVDGLVLMERPMELTLEARAEERKAARSAINTHESKIRAGQVDGVTLDTSHPQARAVTKIDREILSGMPVPKD